MPAMSTAKMTARQYYQLGEDPDGLRLELVDGEVEVSPSPNFHHASVVVRLIARLTQHVDKHGLGAVFSDTDNEVSDYSVRRPEETFDQPTLGLDFKVERVGRPATPRVTGRSPAGRAVDQAGLTVRLRQRL